MSNDFILGSFAGIFSTIILGVIIYEILKFDFKRLKFQNVRDYISYKTAGVLFISFFVAIFCDLIMWTGISNEIKDFFNLWIISIILAITIFIIFVDFDNTQKKKRIGRERVGLNVSAQLGLFSLALGIECCKAGWDQTEGNLLAHGGIYIAFSSFWIMIFIALTQFVDSQQQDKTVEN